MYKWQKVRNKPFYSNVMLFCPLLGIYSCPLCCANYIKLFIWLYFKGVTIYPASSSFLLAWLLALTKTFVSLAVALLVCLRSKRNLFLQNLRGSRGRHETDRFLNWFRPVEHVRPPLHGSGQIFQRTKTSLDLLFGSHGTLGTVQCFEQYCNLKQNRPFYRYGGHIEFTRVKEYYGMPRGHLLSIYARFSGKKRTSLNISREKGDHFLLQSFF